MPNSKSDLVIELLKSEKYLTTSATENNIQPNLLLNWKKEFQNNASAAFDDKRKENFKDKFTMNAKKRRSIQKCWSVYLASCLAEKNLKKFVDLTTRVSLLQTF